MLVVGTQAIEASPDIDLDVLRTELCPAESLIQRVGRLWRRDDADRADRVPGLAHKTISIAAIDNPKEWQTKPYFAAQLDRVADWIAALDEVDGKKLLRFPDQIQDFINQSSMGLTELFTTLNDDEDDNASGLDEIAELIHTRSTPVIMLALISPRCLPTMQQTPIFSPSLIKMSSPKPPPDSSTGSPFPQSCTTRPGRFPVPGHEALRTSTASLGMTPKPFGRRCGRW